MYEAIIDDNYEQFQQLYQQEGKCDMRVAIYAAKNGMCKYLKHLYLNNFVFSEDVLIAAANNFAALKLLRECGCQWDSQLTAEIARCGNIRCLRYAYINGCSWDSNTTYQAAANGNLECLKYAIENGCPYTPRIYDVSYNNGYYDCAQYLSDSGCL